jgi:hypothetical protein
MNYEFKIGQKVMAEGIRAVIVDREMYDGEPDYLLRPIMNHDEFRDNGCSWFRADKIASRENQNETA